MSYFPKWRPFRREWGVKIELVFSNYATKADLKNATGVDTSKIAEKLDLFSLKLDFDELDIAKLKNVPSGISNLKHKVDKLDIGKLETTPVDLSKLSAVLKMMLLKRFNKIN